MKRMEIHVGGSVREALGEFAAAWRRGARGKRLAEASARLDFAAMGEMIAALTPRRLELLARVASEPGLSIRALSRRLERDYKRVHGDVTALERIGLIERDAAGRLRAPYEELVIRAPLKAAA